MWKAFDELRRLGWLDDPGRAPPRMVAVQVDSCAPIVRAFERGADQAEPWSEADTAPTLASGGIGDAGGAKVPEA